MREPLNFVLNVFFGTVALVIWIAIILLLIAAALLFLCGNGWAWIKHKAIRREPMRSDPVEPEPAYKKWVTRNQSN